jgi:hypothetical protein
LEISPSKQLILNDDINLTGLKIQLSERYLHLRFNNLKGKSTQSNNFKLTSNIP